MRKATVLWIMVIWVTCVVYPHTVAALPSSDSLVVLVDKQHRLTPLDYSPIDLQVPSVLLAAYPDNPEMELRQPAAIALTALFVAAERQAIVLVLSSGYRSYADQQQLYGSLLAEQGASAQETVASPGSSEHQTGLAADIILSPYFCAAQGCFALSRAAAWLETHADQYGFILRYPDYKLATTGYTYEPWHYRYVGKALAMKLYASGQTLEEYYLQSPATGN